MITEELIEILKQHPGRRVVVDGYEYGLHDVNPKHLGIIPIKLNTSEECRINGPHEEVRWEEWDEGVRSYPFDEEALLIGRPME